MTTDDHRAATAQGADTAHLPEGPPSRAWRWLDRAILAGVFVGLIAPGALLAGGVTARPIENRPLLTAPPLTVDGLVDASWFQGVDAYLADNVVLRSYAVRLRAEAYLLSGGTGTPEVVRGRDGWLFPRNAFDPNCRHTTAEITAALNSAAAALEAKGIDFRFLAVPDKHTIYPERVADNPFPPACTELGRAELRAALAGLDGRAIDGWAILEAAKAADPKVPVYYRGDTHWTPVGALGAIRALVTSIDPAAWNEAEVEVSGSRRHVDDLARLLGAQRIERPVNVVVRRGVEVVRTNVPVDFELNNAPAIFTTTLQTPGGAPVDRPLVEGRTLFLYDSAFNIYVPLVAPWFEHATWVHVGDMQRHPELATTLGPFDTVVVERVERFLYGDDLAAMFRDLVR